MKKINLGDMLTILVCSCDSYEDLWYPFFYLLEKNWKNNTCRIILNTETKSYQYKNLQIDSLGVGNNSTYGKRIRENLKTITTPYTLLLLDDFFIRKEVNVNQIEELIEMLEKESKLAAIYLTQVGSGEKIPYQNTNYGMLKKFATYKLNMQAGIWNTQKLLSYWEDKDNPWLWEIFANFNTFDNDDIFLCINNSLDSPVYYGYNPDGMGVFRGKWVIEDVEPLFKENGIDVDFKKRGIYSKVAEKNIFSNVSSTLSYMLKRMKFKYVIGMCFYYVQRGILRKLGRREKYSSYPEKLQFQYEKRMEERK